jgi:hypothetical protein
LPELSFLKSLQKLFGHSSTRGRFACSIPIPLEQTLNPFAHDLVAIGEDRLPTDANDFHNFSYRVFMLRNHPNH